MIKAKKFLLRDLARKEFVQQGFSVEEKRGRGLTSGSRLTITKNGEPAREVAVRASLERLLSFTRHAESGGWRILTAVDYVAAVVPSVGKRGGYDVLVFEAPRLQAAFDRALAFLRKEKRVPSPEMPIFVPLDKSSRKNVGHSVAGLAREAFLHVQGLDIAIDEPEPEENFFDRVKREFAERNQIDPQKVKVRFEVET